jgi:XTP/dITP diphosphohydrolase
MKPKIIILASRNAHKTAELAAMLGNAFEVKNLRDFPNAPEVVEDADTFAGNATLKAVTLANWLAGFHFDTPADSMALAAWLTKDQSAARKARENWYVLADDSGLEVDALGGQPGVHSARFANDDTGAPGNSSDADNNAKLLRLLADEPRPWKARFRCVLAFTPVPSNPAATFSPTCNLSEAEVATRLFDGACEGEIIPLASGASGFGYDPLFVPSGFGQTFAELGDETKNKFSHRAEAMKKFKAALG